MLRALVGFSALATAVVTIGSITGAHSLRDSYGNRVEVAVARTDLRVGQVITEQDFERHEIPGSLIAAGAASEPRARTVIEPIDACSFCKQSNPMLCLVFSYFEPGFPSPTTSFKAT